MIKKQAYDFKIDIWAFGCVVFYLASLEPPFVGENFAILSDNIINKEQKEIPKLYSDGLRAFVNKLLTKKAVDRPTTKKVLKMFPMFARRAFESEVLETSKPFFNSSSQVAANETKPVHIKLCEEQPKPNVHIERMPVRPSTVSFSLIKSSEDIKNKERDLNQTESSSQQKDTQKSIKITRDINKRIIICFNQQKRPTTSNKAKLTLTAFKSGGDWVSNPLDPRRPTSAGLEIPKEVKRPEVNNIERPQTVFNGLIKNPTRVLPRPIFFRPVITQHTAFNKRQVGTSARYAYSVIKTTDSNDKESLKYASKKLTILDL